MDKKNKTLIILVSISLIILIILSILILNSTSVKVKKEYKDLVKEISKYEFEYSPKNLDLKYEDVFISKIIQKGKMPIDKNTKQLKLTSKRNRYENFTVKINFENIVFLYTQEGKYIDYMEKSKFIEYIFENKENFIKEKLKYNFKSLFVYNEKSVKEINKDNVGSLKNMKEISIILFNDEKTDFACLEIDLNGGFTQHLHVSYAQKGTKIKKLVENIKILKNKYVFSYFSYDKIGKNPVKNKDVLNDNIVIYAQYEKDSSIVVDPNNPTSTKVIEYTLTIENGSQSTIKGSIENKVLDLLSSVTANEKPGYTFKEWVYSDNSKINSEDKLDSNKSVKPEYKVIEYTLTIENGSQSTIKGSIENKVLDLLSSVTANEKPGYTFKEWVYSDNSKINSEDKLDSNKSVKPEYKVIEYTLIIENGSQSTIKGSIENKVLDLLSSVTANEKPGYTFKEWVYSDNSKINSEDKLDSNKSVKPEYKVIEYTLTIENGSQSTIKGSIENKVLDLLSSVTANEKPGYTFKEWVYSDNSKINSEDKLDSNKSVKPEYKVIEYTLTIENGSQSTIKGSIENKVLDLLSSVTANEKPGYTFKEWVYSDNSKINSEDKLDSNKSVKPEYKVIEYTLTIENGSQSTIKGSIENKVLDLLSSVTANEKPGYTFKEWVYSDNSKINSEDKLDSNKSVKPEYKVIEYTLTIENGSQSTIKGSIENKVLDLLSSVTANEKPGYTFKEWVYSDNSKINSEDKLDSNKSVKPEYKVIEYTLTIENGSQSTIKGSIENKVLDLLSSVTANEKPGYTFKEWVYSDNSKINSEDKLDSNKSVKPEYKVIEYTLIIENGSQSTIKGSIENKVLDLLSSVTANEKPGYTFKEWVYSDNSKINSEDKLDSNKSVKPEYKVIEYTLTIENGSQSTIKGSIENKVLDLLSSVTANEKPGYTFKEWVYSDNSKINSEDKLDSNKSVKPEYKVIEYTLTIENGSQSTIKGSIENKVLDLLSSVTANEKPGYTFKEWVYSDNSKINSEDKLDSNKSVKPEYNRDMEIFTNFYNTFILNKKGEIYVFGNNEYGQLGLGNNINQKRPKRLPKSSYGNKKVKNISLGGKHSMILTEEDDIYVFGNNEYGQLGLNDNTNRNTPTLLPKSSYGNKKVKNISLGENHSMILTEDGDVYVFGWNTHGQLGLNDNTNRNTPTLLPKSSYGNKNAKSISLGGNHSMILTENDDVYMFGWNTHGQLGLGNTISKNVPTLLLRSSYGNKKVKNISLGFSHSMILTEDGDIYVFGNNVDGQLGLGNTISKNVPTLLPKSSYGNKKAKSISTTSYGHSMILTEDGDIYIFGNNDDGQLGLGNDDSKNTPTLLPKSSYGNKKAKSILTGGNHSIILTEDDDIYVFGNNISGQLGLGNIISKNTPTLLSKSLYGM